MKRLLFVLMFVSVNAHAQEVRGPFDMFESEYPTYNLGIVTDSANADIVKLFATGPANSLRFWVYSTVSESLLSSGQYVVDTPPDWHNDFYGPVVWNGNWSVVSRQSSRPSAIDYTHNRTVLLSIVDGSFSQITIDSGRTHPYWVDSNWSSSSNFRLFPRRDGGFCFFRRHSIAELDTSGEYHTRNVNRLLEFAPGITDSVSRIMTCTNAGSYAYFQSWHADTVFSIRVYNHVQGCLSTQSSDLDLPGWEDCSIWDYALLYTRERVLLHLTGYSPIFQIKRLSFDGTCQLISEIHTTAQESKSHPDYGFVLMTKMDNSISIGQIDIIGNLVRPSTVVYESESYLYLDEYMIADNGDICVMWSEDVNGVFTSRVMIIPWDAVLDAPKAESPVIPSDLSLSSYPNPFNSTVTIQYDLPQAGHAKLTAYDLQGRVVATLFDDFAPAGNTELHWSPENLASGVYFITLEAPLARTTHKILFLK